MAKTRVVLSSPEIAFGLDENAWRQSSSAARRGGRQVWELAHSFAGSRSFARFLGERYRAGDLEQVLKVHEEDGRQLLRCRRGDVELVIRWLGKKGPEDAIPGHWGATAEAMILDDGSQVACIHFVAAAAGIISKGAALYVLARAARSLAGYFSKLRAVSHPAAVEGVLEAAEEEAVGAAEGEGEEVAVTCSGVAGLAAGVALIAIGLAVEFLLSNVMHHRLLVYNATGHDLHWRVAHIDAGEIFQMPRPWHGGGVGAHGRIPKVGEAFGVKLGKFGQFSSQTSDFAEGLGYLLRFEPNGGLPEGGWAKIQVPYWGDNSVRVSLRREGSPSELWDRWDDSYEKLHDHVRSGEMTFSLGQDALDGEQTNPDAPSMSGYFYNAILVLSQRGIWSRAEVGSAATAPGASTMKG